MAEEKKSSEAATIEQLDEMSPIDTSMFKVELPQEYRVGHNKVPGPLLALYVLVFLWAAISWIPFYGY